VVALIGGSIIDNALETALMAKFVAAVDRKEMFSSADAPLCDMASKIRLGFALGLYGPVTLKEI
jgi:hypothetical protein